MAVATTQGQTAAEIYDLQTYNLKKQQFFETSQSIQFERVTCFIQMRVR
jgi:hypothetical protein